MQCTACRKEIDPQSSFCPACGTPLAANVAGNQQGYTPVADYTKQPGYVAAPGQPVYAAQPMTAGTGLSDNTAAAVAYITFIPAVVFLVLEPYNKVPFIRFHSWQSIFLFLGAFALQVAVSIMHVMLHFIPLIWILFSIVHFVIAVALFIVWLIALLKASKGEWYKIPLIGDFAEKARGV